MNKITVIHAIESLQKSSKGFSLIIEKQIEEHGADEISWETEIEEYGGIYNIFSLLARYVEDLLKNKQNQEIQSIFNLVEIWHINGDDLLQEATTIGFVEEIISLNPKHNYKDEEFLPFMGKETKFWVKQVKGFWEDGTIIKDERNV